MEKGVVKFWNEDRGYGFIQRANGEDIFVHISEVEGKELLEKGERVLFEIGQGKKGEMAVKVKRSG